MIELMSRSDNLSMRRFFLYIFLFISTSLAAQELTILHMNDTHSHIEPQRSGRHQGRGGVIEQAAYIDSVVCAEGKRNVILLHAGDFSQGTSYFTELNGDIEIEVLNAMGTDAVCLGNHEFDNGLDELARRLRNLECPALCANYDFSETRLKGLVKPYVILRKANRKIGIIGLLTDLSLVVGEEVSSVLKYQNPADVADLYGRKLKESGCDLVIALTHLGYEGELYTDVELASQTHYVDIIVGGHSHTRIDRPSVVTNPDGKGVLVVTDGKWGLEIGKLTVR